jgi:thioredoxin reductase
MPKTISYGMLNREADMVKDNQISLDIAVIGGGPSGISACLELSKSAGLKIALFERESELGGIPRSSHIFFGMRDLRQILTGPEYARRLNTLVRRTSVEIHTESTVIKIVPGSSKKRHRINVVSPQGIHFYNCRAILLTTGCFEISRGARMIPGMRPTGIFTTGMLQELANLRQQRPGTSAVIIGSEHIALSSVLTLRRKGISIAGMVEEDLKLHTFSSAARAMGLFYHFPIYRGTSVQSILGRYRVEGVQLAKDGGGRAHTLKCDTVIITGKFRPYSSLIDFTPIQMDSATFGPLIDMNFMTSVPNIFAAGNILRGADMHDLCALEGKRAAKNILSRLESSGYEKEEGLYLRAESPIRYVVPQKILPDQIKSPLMPQLVPGCSIQLEHSLDKPVLEAWSGDKLIWRKAYFRLIANHRIPIPIWKFDLSRADKKTGVTLRVRNHSKK